MAGEFRYQYGYDIPVHFLAKKIADENQVCVLVSSLFARPWLLTFLSPLQVFTQHAYKRALGCNIMLCGCVTNMGVAGSLTCAQNSACVAAWMTNEARSCSRLIVLVITMATRCDALGIVPSDWFCEVDWYPRPPQRAPRNRKPQTTWKRSLSQDHPCHCRMRWMLPSPHCKL
jgi:hypothetical protein